MACPDDPDALAIGELYRKAKDALGGAPQAESVTDTRYFSGKLSQSRNDDDRYRLEPNGCHWCREAFKPGQMRYPVTTATSLGWSLVSVCMDCFKCTSDDDETHEKRQQRYQRQCRGCGEPMLTPLSGVFAYQVCSRRCYQRAYRKRRRESGGSTVPWKGHSPTCAGCKRPFVPSRKDARYCSNACRQRAYRGRVTA
jgi:hypothetical protein